eukprot:16440613-Heterocapsa_arctica.AAC.1
MVGDPSDKKCKTKGAETWGLLLFLVDTLRGNTARLDAEATVLADAGQALVELVSIFDEGGARLTPGEIQGCFDAWKRHCSLTETMLELRVPKRH